MGAVAGAGLQLFFDTELALDFGEQRAVQYFAQRNRPGDIHRFFEIVDDDAKSVFGDRSVLTEKPNARFISRGGKLRLGLGPSDQYLNRAIEIAPDESVGTHYGANHPLYFVRFFRELPHAGAKPVIRKAEDLTGPAENIEAHI